MVAAGSGSRLGAPVPKALVALGGRSLVRHAVDAMVAGGAERVVVTCPAGHEAAFAETLCDVFVPVHVVAGGAERQDSVRVGLEALRQQTGDAVVLVHDAARPLVPPEVTRRVVDAVRAGAAAVVPVVPVADSIREVGERSRVVPRDALRAVQTPQGFPLTVLGEAHRLVEAQGLSVTDDAAAAEAAGHPVTLVDGDHEAFKITGPLDLLLAEAVLAGRQP